MSDERHDRLAAQIATGGTAELIAVVARLVTVLITARALGPHARGVFAIGSVLAGVAGMAVNLGLPVAAMTFAARREVPLAALRGAGTAIAVFAGVILTTAFLFMPEAALVGPLRGLPREHLWLLGVAAGFGVSVQYSLALLQGAGRIRSSAQARVIGALLVPPVAIVSVTLLDASPLAALILVVITYAVPAMTYTVIVSRHVRPTLPSSAVLRQLAAYGTRTQPGSLSRVGFQRVDYFAVNALLGTAAAGVYSVAVALAEGLTLAVQAVNRALVGRIGAPDARASASLIGSVFRLSTPVLAIAIPAAVLVVALLLPVLFGRAYDGARLPFALLAVGTPALGLYYILATYVQVQRLKPLVVSITEFVALFASLPLYWTLIMGDGMAGAAAASVIVYWVLLLASVMYFRRLEETAGISLRSGAAEIRMLRDFLRRKKPGSLAG